MSSSGVLVIISCNESTPNIDPSRYFNLATNNTSVVKTAGGRTADTINSLYAIDAQSRIGMIVVLQHSGCASTSGNTETNIRQDVTYLKASPYVRNDIPIIGYMLDTPSGQLREVNVATNSHEAEARRRVLSQMDDFGPFWS